MLLVRSMPEVARGPAERTATTAAGVNGKTIRNESARLCLIDIVSARAARRLWTAMRLSCSEMMCARSFEV